MGKTNRGFAAHLFRSSWDKPIHPRFLFVAAWREAILAEDSAAGDKQSALSDVLAVWIRSTK
jgi:hypothetical protein